MENIIIANCQNEVEKSAGTHIKMIDDRSFAVHVLFPTANAETMQGKIECMLHRDIVNVLRQSAV